VAAGAIAKKYLKEKLGIEFISYVEQVGDMKTDIDFNSVTAEMVEAHIVRCPDPEVAEQMIKLIEEVRDDGDSIGGVVRGVIKGLPIGLGEPVFDKLPADLAKAMVSINAVKGFEIGSGFAGVSLRGSQHNDQFYTDKTGAVHTKTNHAGGTLGGISNGETVYFRVAIKPVSTIKKQQDTVNVHDEAVQVTATGRHDPCVLPRAIPIVDAMAALVIMDHYLRNKAQNS
jgi:chorismate synthase